MRASFLVVVFVAALLYSAEKKAEPNPLDGKWEVVAAKFDGADVQRLKGRMLAFTDSKMVVDGSDKKENALSYTLDTKADPMQIDLERASAKQKALGIFVIEKDELKICYGEPSSVRPKEFDSRKGDKNFLLILKRAKAD